MYEEYFNHIPQQVMKDFFLEKIAPLGKHKSYKKNEQIDYFDNAKLAIVISGCLKICIYTKSGLEKILFFLTPGEIYGEESLFYPHIDVTPIPMEDTTISFIDNEVLQNFLISHPLEYKYLFQSILRKYQIALFQMGDLLKKSPKAQICSALSRLVAQRTIDNSSPEETFELDVYLTHEVLGNIIGCSRVTVTRVLNELKTLGIIDTANRKFKILNIEALKDLSE